jgi:hypothetical protein
LGQLHRNAGYPAGNVAANPATTSWPTFPPRITEIVAACPADGHSETKKWRDAATPPLKNGLIFNGNTQTPARERDVAWLKDPPLSRAISRTNVAPCGKNVEPNQKADHARNDQDHHEKKQPSE